MEATMKRLLFFTYCGTVFLAVTCKTNTLDKEDPRNGLLRRLVVETQEQPSLLRQRRQNRFSPGDFPFSPNFRPSTGGFNWGSSKNNYEKETGSSSRNIIFEDLEELLRPNIPASTRAPPTSSTVAIPGMATSRSPCEVNCPATHQYDPVCGDNNVTYTNIYWLKCAQRCGKSVNIQFRGACPRVP